MTYYYYKGRYLVEVINPPMEISLLLHEEDDFKNQSFGREIDRQKETANAWKKAWYCLRDKLGHLWWEHPAIESDEKREQYRSYKKL